MKIPTLLLVLVAFLGGAAAGSQGQLLAPLNDGVNALLSASGAANRDASKTVPIVASGGSQLGYAQVTGGASALRAVRAVVRIDAPGQWNIAALIPVSTIGMPGGTVHRVYGVAVDALVNYGS